MNDRCFVISPIGQEGTKTRRDSDDVFRFIIEPAMKKCGLKAVRSDQIAEPGKISDRMYDEILNDRLCIAVLTGLNPNVFYELAIRQSAEQPVILLVEHGTELPFDVKDMNAIFYDMSPTPLADKVYAEKVVKAVRELEEAGWRAKIPFGEGLEPLGGARDSEFLFVERSEKYGPSEDWLKLLEETEASFEIMGINLRLWRRTRGFRKVLTQKAEDGCNVRVLLMHEDNPALPSLINVEEEEDADASLGLVRSEIVTAMEFYSRLAGEHEQIEARQILAGCPHYQLMRSDRYAMVIPYLYSEGTGYSPLWRCPADHYLYSVAKQEFATLWDANPPE